LGRIGTFSVEQMIGQGGMGIVYKGFDSELNRPVAIKVLAEHLSNNGVARQRFAREARAAAAVIHPNVVPIYSVNSSAQRPFIVMALVPGLSLQAYVQKHGPMPVKEVVRIGKQIASGLAAAHREGLVHRDIKPANILLESDVSRVMITDFGLARAADDAAITQTGWLAGTPHYMSPEQSSGKEVDQRSDLFSLGSVLYFLATGREPFRAEIPFAILKKIVSDEPASMRSINSEVTKTLNNIIEKLMSKEPDYRFQSADEVESIMTQYLAHLEQPATQPKPKIKPARKSKINSLTFFAVTSLLVFATLLPIWLSASWTVKPASPAMSPPRLLPEGLQSPAQWQSTADAIEYEIQQLESLTPFAPPVILPNPMDPIDSEVHSLRQQIDQLEVRLGTK
ncbi:MAG: serine/threonine-protein kinase, partial [Planctomycetota bacterium]